MSEQDRRSSPQDPPDAGLNADRQTLDSLFSVTYEELRRLATRVRRRDWNSQLSPTTLVNEAWIKLAASPAFRSMSPLHFKRIAARAMRQVLVEAARAMRQVLVEAARRRHAAKRGGDDAVFVTFDDAIDHSPYVTVDLLALDTALDDLGRVNPRQAAMIESR